jgi:hypothetical protein
MTDTPDALIEALCWAQQCWDERDHLIDETKRLALDAAAQALRARLTAGDAAIKELEETKLERGVWQRDAATKQELWRKAAEDRAAAIMRVVDLEAARGDGWATVDLVRAGLVRIIGDGYEERSVLPAVARVERIVASLKADLAAARAEIERLRNALVEIASLRGQNKSELALLVYVMGLADAALAPKENAAIRAMKGQNG